MTFVVRRVTADDWPEVKALRLRALADEAAPIAFLDTLENASAMPDEFWQDRADTATGEGAIVQVVAVTDAGEWAGSVSVLALAGPTEPGLVVGVYVAPEHRGAGIIDALLESAGEWARERDLPALDLGVHADNARAQAVYSRCGFVRIGETEIDGFGPELLMRRGLGRDGNVPV